MTCRDQLLSGTMTTKSTCKIICHSTDAHPPQGSLKLVNKPRWGARDSIDHGMTCLPPGDEHHIKLHLSGLPATFRIRQVGYLAALEAAQVLQLVGARSQPHRPQQLRLDHSQLVRATAVAAAPVMLLCSHSSWLFSTISPYG